MVLVSFGHWRWPLCTMQTSLIMQEIPKPVTMQYLRTVVSQFIYVYNIWNEQTLPWRTPVTSPGGWCILATSHPAGYQLYTLKSLSDSFSVTTGDQIMHSFYDSLWTLPTPLCTVHCSLQCTMYIRVFRIVYARRALYDRMLKFSCRNY